MRWTGKALGILAAMAALATPGWAGAADHNWRVSVVTPEGHPYNVALAAFKKRVEEGSDGRIGITVFPSGQLGDEVESAKNLQLGTLEMTIISTSNASPFYKELEVFGVPYSFKSLSCAFKVLDGEVGQEMAAGLREGAGMRVLGWYTFGMRQLFNTERPIETPDDMSGLVFRVPADKMAEAAYKALGANPVPMGFNEMFNALQQGVIDGADNPLITLKAFKWYEVVPHVTISNTAAGLSPFLVSEQAFSALPEDLQQLVIEAGSESAEVNRTTEEAATRDARAFLAENGVAIVEPDIAQFREKVQPVFDEAAELFGQALLDRIQAAQSGC
ncbi:TRAP transporter substrate-binding protein [Paralimibaculum aggregatum]|uniref:TRAP transporter substrate-binding protein n=1 Tax=Paralimibaculum aggregatum TaxID=3036245 RepID=A0ABQ6LIZ0_9RHOB|nr:TRAP transporter substrate-binding protein [Limibaculum sp. NKW23]GMG82119.1 TRAP transporter substrate-binding protein [Limibaculum sp. NKW23]